MKVYFNSDKKAPRKKMPKRVRKKKLPKSISIGSHNINIIRKELDDCFGYFDPAKLEIAIGSTVDDTLAWETLWHEVVEAINFFSEADMEHKSIQVFGLLLHQVIDSIYCKNTSNSVK
tara:strand:+ start:2005 stop:2358 length:354 start_codon:yes stop_codon:yes gene_type:complete